MGNLTKMIYSVKNECFMLIIVLVLCSCTKGSQTLINIVRDGKQLENPCQNEVLASVVPGINENLKSTAFEGNDTVRDICPFLKYTCCNENQLKTLASQLNDSFKFLSFRSEQLYNMFLTINEIQEKNFQNFLENLKQSDVDCYNKMQDGQMQNVLQNDEKESKTKLAALKKEYYFNESSALENFQKLKEKSVQLLKQIRSDDISRKKYYSNIVCNMCSPVFSKYMNKTDEGEDVLEVRVDQCNQLLRNAITVLKNIMSYQRVQRVLDLSFCARTNSMKSKNFNGGTADDMKLWTFDLKEFNDYINKNLMCIKYPKLYMATDEKDSFCRKQCYSGLRLFDINVITMNKVFRAENEIWNMFRNNSSSSEAEVRIKTKLEDYSNFRKIFINLGILKLETGQFMKESIQVLPSVSQAKFSFKQTKISVDKVSGLTFVMTDMNPKYYNFSLILQSSILLVIGLFLKLK